MSSGGAAATRQNENYFTNWAARKPLRGGRRDVGGLTATFSVLEEDVRVLKSPEERPGGGDGGDKRVDGGTGGIVTVLDRGWPPVLGRHARRHLGIRARDRLDGANVGS